jgi:hypothetical protein
MSESFPLSFWPVGDAIVVSDLPPLLNAQDLVEIDARDRREGRALTGRLDRKPRVVGWPDRRLGQVTARHRRSIL